MQGTCTTHLILLDFVTLLKFIEQYSSETPQYATYYYFLQLSAS